MRTETPDLHCLLHAAALVEERLRRRLSGLGLPPRQARVLDALDRMGQASQADLARAFDIKPSSMSTMTVRLLEAGYILRSADPDEGRTNILQLSDKGRALLVEVRTAWADIDQLIGNTIGAADATRLAALTRSLRDGLGGKPPVL